jgi:hypothetical protein
MFKHCLPLRGVNGESKVNSQRQFIRLFSLIAFAVVSVVGVSNKVDAYGVSPWVDTSGPGGGTVYYYSASGFSCGVSLSQVCNFGIQRKAEMYLARLKKLELEQRTHH